MLASYLEKINNHIGFYNIINDHSGKLFCKIKNIVESKGPSQQKKGPSPKDLSNFIMINK